MRTRTRFVLLFAALGLLVMVLGLAGIYRAVARDSASRLPLQAEAILAAEAARGLAEGEDARDRLGEATRAISEARALLAQGRVMVNDPVIGLALQVAAILAGVLASAALIFVLLARVFTRGIDELAAGVARVGTERAWRFPASEDPELGRVRKAINELLDLVDEQERRLAAGARLEGWREVASFLAHQIKNPLAALALAARNGDLALGRLLPAAAGSPAAEAGAVAGESLAIVREETERLATLINRFRDLAPAGLAAYGGGSPLGLRSLLDAVADRARDAGAEVRIEGPDLGLIADRALLEQAFWNLAANSLEAPCLEPSAGVRASISIVAAAEGGRALVTFGDSGRIDPDLVPGLGTERRTSKRGGTGLGLILVRRLIAIQGGSIEFSVGGGGGLVAKISLPIAGEAP